MDDNLYGTGDGSVTIGDVVCWCGKFGYIWGLDLLWWLR